MSKVTVNKINTQFSEKYTEQDLNLIPSFEVISQFTPETDVVEFSIYNEQGLLEYINYNYTDYTVTLDYNTQQNSVSSVNVNVEEDVIKEGYEQGNYTANYTFSRNQLSSSTDNPYYIKQISSDRTEIRIANNNIENEELENIVNQFKTELNESVYFEDFQINLGNNNIFIANNILVDTSDPSQYTVLIKLYEPLEEQFEIKDTLWVTLQTADEVSYQVNFTPKVVIPPPPPQLKGPNFNIETKDTANNSTAYQDLSSLLDTVLTASYNQIQGILAEKGITINIDYTDFNNFVYFSSAEKRVRNFYYKLQELEGYDNEITTLRTTLLNNSGSSIDILERKKGEIIQNFDGYEKFQYYTSGSRVDDGIYPKLADYPYRPVRTTTNEANNWLRQETTSGSNYDLDNFDRLVNSLPNFVTDNTDNVPFLDFMDMVGQHFDNIWTYTKDISNRFDADNRLNYGISKDLVADAIRSMGVNLYQNNFTDTNLYTAFTNLNPDGTGSYLNQDTNEVIFEYVTTQYNDTGLIVPSKTYNQGDVFFFQLASGNPDSDQTYFYVNEPTFTAPAGTTLDAAYLVTLLQYQGSGIIPISDFDGQPTIIDDVNKSIYKRIYHNLPYLLKKKGSIEGLRALINCYGIPDTILRISEFGGKDKTNSNDWDYFQNKFNYALSTSGSWGYFTSGFLINSAWPERMGFGPTTFTMRFKPDTLPSSDTDYKVLVDLLKIGAGAGEWALALEYTGSGLLSSSYSGSIPSESKYDANLVLWDKLGGDVEIARVTAPFYNGNWWTTAITVDPTAATEGDVVLYALESIYNGNDGFKLGINTSASYSGDTEWWDGTQVYIPSQVEAGLTIDGTSYTPLTGSFQEVRYYGVPLSRNKVYDLAMNPYSIEGNDYSSSASDLAFRAPLGSDLLLTSLTQSVHPKITGSFGFITQSFGNNSYYRINETIENNFVPNTEFIYYDQPAVGIKNRISEKIRSVDNIIPSGDTLTPYRTIQQRYPQSESYTRDVNYLEVAFSPQNEINDDINSSFGYFDIGEYIGDPRQVSESNTSYQDLDRLRDDYFQKYYKSYDWKDYIRLIKYFDNSLFKMIKDFVPAKTSVSTGVVIKQHLLERNKHRPALLSSSLHEYTGSISSGFIEGGTGGVLTGLDNSTISTGSFRSTGGSATVPTLNPAVTIGTPSSEILFAKSDSKSIVYNNDSKQTNRVIYTLESWSVISDTTPDGLFNLSIRSKDRDMILGTIYNIDANNLSPNYPHSIIFNILPDETIEIITQRVSNTGKIILQNVIQKLESSHELIANPLTVDSVSGSVNYIQTTQDEFYNGEFNGNNITITDGNLNTVIVTEESDSFVANYPQASVNSYGITAGDDDGRVAFTYGGARGKELIQFVFEQQDFDGIDRSEYFDSLSPGDTILLKVTTYPNIDAGFIELTINSIYFFTPALGIEKYVVSIVPIYPFDPGIPTIFQSYDVNTTPSLDVTNVISFDLIYDQASSEFQTSLIGDEPLQNNIINSRQSIYFQDVDYSSGDGVLRPTNYLQILTGSATPAQVPDSNYTQKGWLSGRYNGTRVSSRGFNIKSKNPSGLTN